MFQPGGIVMCSGADSLSGDRLTCFNLSLQGHAHCNHPGQNASNRESETCPFWLHR